jgi:hypothetical protein
MQVSGELSHVEAKVGCIPDEVARGERVLMRQKQVVHVPELSLTGRGLDRTGRSPAWTTGLELRTGRPPGLGVLLCATG